MISAGQSPRHQDGRPPYLDDANSSFLSLESMICARTNCSSSWSQEWKPLAEKAGRPSSCEPLNLWQITEVRSF